MDQGEEEMDVYPQQQRDGFAAKRFFRRLLRSYDGEVRKIVTDTLRSYGVAHRELVLESIHGIEQYENNRAEQSHEATEWESEGCGVNAMVQDQRFVTAHAAVSN